MLIAGEASGDQLASELVAALREKSPGAVFFGAGGNNMKAAGVDLLHDMGRLGVVGITDIVKNIFEIRRLQKMLLAEAIKRKPDVVIGVDYGGFNLRFGHAVKQYLRDNPFVDWKPKVVQFISPQVWASRPKRADRMAPDYDLLLSIFPFEKEWYSKRVPQLRVEFVGHPMVERFQNVECGVRSAEFSKAAPNILLLPGSRRSELKQHLPAMLGAWKLIREKIPQASASMVVPNETIAELARSLGADMPVQTENITTALAATDLAMAKTGTVTMECAFFRVPAVTFYKGSWLNYQIVRHYVTVKFFTMANLLAGEEVYPEFLQYALTPENLANAALEILQSEDRRVKMRAQLDKVIASLGGPGAARRAADAVLSLLP
jgi:lipid-A-disaccharide synthase